MTDFFLHYVHHKDLTVGLGDGKELKEKVIQWIQHATEEERSGFGEVMLCKQMTLDEWLDKFGVGMEKWMNWSSMCCLGCFGSPLLL